MKIGFIGLGIMGKPMAVERRIGGIKKLHFIFPCFQ